MINKILYPVYPVNPVKIRFNYITYSITAFVKVFKDTLFMENL